MTIFPLICMIPDSARREPAMKGALKAAALQSKSPKELYAVFKRFDTDNSGRIDRVETKRMLASMGFNASEVCCSSMYWCHNWHSNFVSSFDM